eukprot:m.170205 g.170205  ORF g.170205 m.170205 type:complete len:683 (+) comp14523_c0_seq1:583-2631(+)
MAMRPRVVFDIVEEDEEEDEDQTLVTGLQRLDLQSAATAATGSDLLPTEAVSLVSHTHGRQRRAQRGIERYELQQAVKYGRRERAHPGRHGQERWRYTYQGVVYITDATSRHEITSWRIDENTKAAGPIRFGELAGFSCHVVLVVDHSGSMKKSDVPGYTSRTEAVYSTLRREFLQPQLDLAKSAAGATSGDAVVSLIEMSSYPIVLLNRVAVDEALSLSLQHQQLKRGRSHGHYVPALDELDRMLQEDVRRQVQVIVFFLSDGSPSDHIHRTCRHSVAVWGEDPIAIRRFRGKTPLQSCGLDVRDCRAQIKRQVREDCCSRVRVLGLKFGLDRFQLHTVAFGNPNDDYTVLQEMANAVPRGSFQKLGLAVGRLGTALSSLTSTLTTMRTTSGGTALTLRGTRKRESTASFEEQIAHIKASDDWDIYTGRKLLYKQRYDQARGSFVDVPLAPDVVGVAIKNLFFAQGGERTAHRCTEVAQALDGTGLIAAGYPLVSKETLFVEELENAKFHERIAREHAHGQKLADVFNERVQALFPDRPELTVNFAPVCIYKVVDWNYDAGVAWILAEPRLDGKYFKWNNNAGGVGSRDKDPVPSGIESTIPQVFSHFSWSVSDRKELLCDLQGVWNSTDGFTFTDPCRHVQEVQRKRRKRRTDKGTSGIKAFFKTHECTELCKLLGLHQH